ncbi:MAG: diaminopimelate decarboxylase [Acidobacteriaceae bacterium]
MTAFVPRRTENAQARPFHYSEKASRAGARELLCDRVRMTALARQYGTPLYVYSATNIRQRVRLFHDAFAGTRTTLCYSVKANSNLSILRLLAGLGTGFDTVSGGELERVRQAAKPSLRQVVFSGVGKTAAEIDAALAAKILVFNVESAAELDLLEQRARHLRRIAPIAMRVNPDVFAETHPYISTGMSEHKFGVEMSAASALYGRAARSKYLDPTGVSVHIGSQIRSAQPFGQALRRVQELVQELKASQGVAVRHIDAGGGVGISYQLQDSQPFDPQVAVTAYAAEVRAALAGFDGELLLEPGRFLVAQAGALVTQVLHTKQNGGKTFVVTDAGMNDLIRPALYQAYHAILPLRSESDRAQRVVDVVGPVCETGDFFARDRELPEVSAGDHLAILDAGAYGMSLSSNYNSRNRAAEVLVDGGTHRLIRRRETLRDQMAAEKSLLQR